SIVYIAAGPIFASVLVRQAAQGSTFLKSLQSMPPTDNDFNLRRAPTPPDDMGIGEYNFADINNLEHRAN
ncbi:hypothetical protein HAX54_000949, partial [Datura stramonium]|nr:hypothetical protein [Datura stramonium]